MVPISRKPSALCRPTEAGMLRPAADHGDHLAEPQAFANRNELAEQSAADAEPLRLRRNVDAVLDRIAVGGPRAIGAGIGIAEQGAVAHRYDMGKAPLHEVPPAPRHLRFAGRLDLVGRRAVQHRVGVDRSDCGNIALDGGAELENP